MPLFTALIIAATLMPMPQQPQATVRPPGLHATSAIHTDRYGDPLPPGAKLRFGCVRGLVHSPNLPYSSQGMTFSPDGRTFLTCNNFTIFTVDVESGRELSRVEIQWPGKPTGFGEFVNNAFSSDCKTLATIQRGAKRVCFFDVPSGRFLREFSVAGSDPITLEWSRDGSTIMAQDGNAVHRLRLWDVRKGEERDLKMPSGETARPRWGSFSPDSRFFAAAITDESVAIWDLSTEQVIRQLQARRNAMDFSCDGAIFGCIEQKGEVVTLWNMATGKEMSPIGGARGKPVTGFAFSPDGKLLAFSDNSAFVWDIAKRKLLHVFPFPAGRGCVFSADGRKIACIEASTLRIWDVATGQELRPLMGHAGPVDHVVPSPDGKLLASTSTWEHLVLVWRSETGEKVRAIDLPRSINHVPSFSSDSKSILMADDKGIIRQVDVATGRAIREFHLASAGEGQSFQTIESHLSTDMKTLAALGRASGHEVASIRVWETATGKLLTRREVPGCRNGKFSEDNQLIAMATMETRPDPHQVVIINKGGMRIEHFLLIQETASGRPLSKTATGYVVRMAFAPDGRSLAAVRHKANSGTPEICVWEVATGNERLSFDTKGYFYCVWSNDSRLAATHDSGSFSIWDVITGQHLFTQRDSSECLAFAPDGKTIFTGMGDRTIVAWELPLPKHLGIQEKALSQKDLRDLWADLANADAAKAHVAMWTLIATPAKAVSFLQERIRTVSGKDLESIQRSIDDLDNSSFAAREAAQNELRRFYFDARPFLLAALERKPSLEKRRRIDGLLSLPSSNQPSESLAGLRAIEVLEHIGNKDTRKVLEALAQGASSARLTQEAKQAQQRLNRGVKLGYP
jgi:WD40 repeat protein